ncbi:MAG: outer membrane beta-barrel protein [Alphaproteobacteria bacterium]
MTGRFNKVQLLVGVSATAIALSISTYSAAETGMPLGSGTLNTEVTVGWHNQDNHFAAEVQEKDDSAVVFAPSFNWTSDWASGNELSLSAETEITMQNKFDQDDTSHYSLGADGKVNLSNSANVTYGAAFESSTESRGSIEDNGSFEPVEYETTSADIAYNRVGGMFEFSVGAEISEKDYEDGAFIDPNTLLRTRVNNDDRDATVVTIFGEASYQVANRLFAYVGVSYNDRNFDELEDVSNIDRDSDGYTVNGGMEILLTDISSVSFGLNYHDQNFDDNALNDVNGLGGEATFIWLPTELTTVAVSIAHQYNDTSQTAVSGSLTQSGALTINHQLTDTLSVSVDGSISRADFEGVDTNNIEREDDTYTAGIAVDYLLNENVSFGAAADYVDRESNVPFDSYDRTKYGASITVRL